MWWVMFYRFITVAGCPCPVRRGLDEREHLSLCRGVPSSPGLLEQDCTCWVTRQSGGGWTRGGFFGW